MPQILPKPVTGKARLALWINDQEYGVTILDPHPTLGRMAVRLTKRGGTPSEPPFYDVLLSPVHGPLCDCPDFNWRRDGRDPKGCKHICALRAVGLLKGN
jgi:hypothetical protein